MTTVCRVCLSAHSNKEPDKVYTSGLNSVSPVLSCAH